MVIVKGVCFTDILVSGTPFYFTKGKRMSMSMLAKVTQAKTSPVGNGQKSEKAFIKAARDRGLFCTQMSEGMDTGIDFIVYAADVNKDKRVYKNVQVTRGSMSPVCKRIRKDGTAPLNSYIVTKVLEKVRADIDIVAVHISHDPTGEAGYSPEVHNRPNCNTGVTGPQDFWFFIPIDVYAHPSMYRYYVNTTVSWSVNIDKHFSPPLDQALNAWYLFHRTKQEVQSKTNEFLNIG